MMIHSVRQCGNPTCSLIKARLIEKHAFNSAASGLVLRLWSAAVLRDLPRQQGGCPSTVVYDDGCKVTVQPGAVTTIAP